MSVKGRDMVSASYRHNWLLVIWGAVGRVIATFDRNFDAGDRRGAMEQTTEGISNRAVPDPMCVGSEIRIGAAMEIYPRRREVSRDTSGREDTAVCKSSSTR